MCWVPVIPIFLRLLIYFEIGGGKDRERERQNPKQAQGCQSRAQCGVQPINHEIMTWAKTKSRMLNQLSHHGTVDPFFFFNFFLPKYLSFLQHTSFFFNKSHYFFIQPIFLESLQDMVVTTYYRYSIDPVYSHRDYNSEEHEIRAPNGQLCSSYSSL